MRRDYRLKRRQDFTRVFKSGRSVANRHFVLYMSHARDGHLPPRIGVSVSKKVAKLAVDRNRVRRVIKEVVRQWIGEFPCGWDFVVIARHPAVYLNYRQAERSLRHLFQKARVLSDE